MIRNLRLLVFLAMFPGVSTSSPDEFYKKIGIEAGTLKIISETSDNCTDGPLKIVGQEGEKVLLVGKKIALVLPAKEKFVLQHASSSNCAEDTISKYAPNGIEAVTRVHSCPPELTRFEAKKEESLTIEGTLVKYKKTTINDFRVECVFQWEKTSKRN